MEPIIWMSMGAAGVVCLILMKIIGQKGWQALQSSLKQHAGAVGADFKAKVTSVVGDIDAKVKDIVHSELAKLESDMAAFKAKVGGLS